MKTSLVAVLVGVVAVFTFVGSAGSAGAQGAENPPWEDNPDHPCYPDGCRPTTTTEPGDEVTCGISVESAVVDAEVTVTVRNVPAGGTVRILVDGDEVARGTNESGVQSIRAMPAQAADVVMTFPVPDLSPGSYSIVAVGSTFTVTCGDGGLQVLASGGDSDDGALAFTGASILLLIVVALALLAVGYVLVRRSRRRRTVGIG